MLCIRTRLALILISNLCCSRKYPSPTSPQKRLEIPWGWGVLKDGKILRNVWSFSGISRGGGRFKWEIPSVGEGYGHFLEPHIYNLWQKMISVNRCLTVRNLFVTKKQSCNLNFNFPSWLRKQFLNCDSLFARLLSLKGTIRVSVFVFLPGRRKGFTIFS